jgi:uncharacterized protein (TIGR02271 family)
MLRRLQDLPNFHVAEGEPDIRGWAVKDRLGTKVGEVDSLLVDTEHDHEDSRGYLPIRYLGLKTENQVKLVPIGLIDIDESKRTAVFREAGIQDASRFPIYDESGMGTKGAATFTSIFKEPTIDYGRAEFQHGSECLTLIEERLKVGKRSAQVGEVIARKRVEEVPVEENITLRKEHVEIERRPVNKPLTEGKFGEGEKEIRMSIMAEEAVVEKVPYVKEEVILHKEIETENKVIRDKVREEELEFAGSEPERYEERKETISEKVRDKIDELKNKE